MCSELPRIFCGHYSLRNGGIVIGYVCILIGIVGILGGLSVLLNYRDSNEVVAFFITLGGKCLYALYQ